MSLHLASGLGRLDVVRDLLRDNADINALDQYGWTPLRHAIYDNHIDVIKELLIQGADPTIPDLYGFTIFNVINDPIEWDLGGDDFDSIFQLLQNPGEDIKEPDCQ